MAALSDTPLVRVVHLHQIRSRDLDTLLEEETQVWNENLSWDFRPSAALVRRFVDMQGLNGYALLFNEHPIGYSYFVSEERKGLIGDLYVLKDFLTPEYEEQLLAAVVDNMLKSGFIERIESQLMMLRNSSHMVLPAQRYLRVHGRTFMEADPRAAFDLAPTPALPYLIDGWSERNQDEAAAVISNAYQGHIDSEINDQYRSPAGARRFLLNIVQFPGCGSFFQPASMVAADPETGKLCGISLSSLVHSNVGHITQVCVTQNARARRLGYELIRRSLESLAKHGCTKVSLTVTTNNRSAIQLYERMGFRKTRDFAALVWEGFRNRQVGLPTIG